MTWRSAVAGSPAVGHEETVGVEGVNVLERGGCRQDMHPHAALGEPDGGHRLDTEVDGGNGEPRFAFPTVVLGVHHVGFVDAYLFGKRRAFHGGACQHGIQQFLVGRVGGFAGKDPGAHGLVLAEMPGDRTGVNALDADDALGDEFFVEAPLGPPVGRASCGVADDVALNPDLARFGVLAVDAGVPDVRRSLHHELAGVGGIGDGLLVTGHAGGEDRFAERGAWAP